MSDSRTNNSAALSLCVSNQDSSSLPSKSDQPIKLLQLTDCHLGEQVGEPLLSMNPDESLLDVLELVGQQRPNNDLAVLTGDLVNHGNLPAYERLYRTMTAHLPAPFAWLPGNHDSPELMASFGEEVNAKVHHFSQWVVILLDTHKPQCVYGHLSEAEVDFLQRTLNENTDKFVMIFLHHHPVPISSQWIDTQLVDNAHEFWKIVSPFKNIKVVSWGHVHQQFQEEYQDITLLATPSTCIQFTPNSADFGVENEMPGYRWFELHDDGTFETGVERVAEKDYGTDIASGGY